MGPQGVPRLTGKQSLSNASWVFPGVSSWWDKPMDVNCPNPKFNMNKSLYHYWVLFPNSLHYFFTALWKCGETLEIIPLWCRGSDFLVAALQTNLSLPPAKQVEVHVWKWMNEKEAPSLSRLSPQAKISSVVCKRFDWRATMASQSLTVELQQREGWSFKSGGENMSGCVENVSLNVYWNGTKP